VIEDILPFAIGSSCLRKKRADRAVPHPPTAV
jgi:hypothetical protein